MNGTLFTTKQLTACTVRPKAEPKVYTLNDVLLFGKYQRQMLRAVAIQDPDYLLHMQEKYNLQFDDELKTFIRQMKFYTR